MEKTLQEQFEDLYEAEGYTLIATAGTLLPWFQCTVRCSCTVEQPMSEFDGIICRCVREGIDSVRDISFVLALEPEIVSGKVDDLTQNGIFRVEDDRIRLTELGEGSFLTYMKVERCVREFPVYMNAITGEWFCEEAKTLTDGKEAETENAIRLHPLQPVARKELEQSADIMAGLERMYDIRVISMELLDYKNILYRQETMLLYRNDKDHILFSLYDSGTERFDVEAAAVLMRRYERRELLEIMQAEKHIKEAERYIVESEPLTSEYRGELRNLRYYQNKEIRELFKTIFDTAEKSVFIVSPWIDHTQYVVTEELLGTMERALRDRRLRISIGYGYTSKEILRRKRSKYSRAVVNQKEMEEDRNWQTELMANKLKERFGIYPGFSIFHIGTHEKILSYDDRYILIGSYNLLSYDGGEKTSYAGHSFRYEGGVLIDDEEFAKSVKERIIQASAV